MPRIILMKTSSSVYRKNNNNDAIRCVVVFKYRLERIEGFLLRTCYECGKVLKGDVLTRKKRLKENFKTCLRKKCKRKFSFSRLVKIPIEIIIHVKLHTYRAFH